MDPQNAITLLNETFDNSYDDGHFSNFIRELFNGFNFSYNVLKNIKKEYKQYIDSYQILGSYSDEKKIIDVLVVKLNTESASRDRARTKQRNFVAKYLGNTNKDAALVAFYGDDPQDWRFSFVKMDYSFTKEGTIVTELTPAKRYSYLVGVNEPNHTCRSQFLDLIIREDKNPSIIEIEDAFSIDNVTKEFFLSYKELFSELRESLDIIVKNNPKVREEFDENSISTVDFSKKLLGQIVFLYFLQKKGWLGVEKGNEWGTGPKDFMMKLFGCEEKGVPPSVEYKNFFNDILEPLFYDALSNPRQGDDGYHTLLKCKIPFLNGGLFEPINSYDWINTEVALENKIFKDIFKIFNRFNFTVKEDEPLDKEVAVDPEMLGKVFENLLEVTDRKSKGAFYTPREIVHYMCQQSLINYLETNTDVPAGDIETFIQYGELAQQITTRANVDEKYIPASIKNERDKIDNLLKNIKVVDPAVGSGAFPMGMMNEIVKARSILSYLRKDVKNNYDLKHETIENCLYGVDIDSSAVDITKLRFWLSLVVDETDIMNIKPLPNLDHRIMCGNSLLEEFEGVKLFEERWLEVTSKTSDFRIEQVNAEIEKLYSELGEIHTGKRKDNGRKKEIETELKKLVRKKKTILSKPKDSKQQSTLDLDFEYKKKESQKKIAEHQRLQKKYFNEDNRGKKRVLAENIDRIEWELIEETLKEQGNEDAMQKLAQYKKNKSKPFFLWKLYFSEVFQRENPGFDVVIANPPYLGEKGHMEVFREIKKGFLNKFYQGKMDIFYFFFHISLNISRIDGHIAFITTNYYPTASGGNKLRSDFKERSIVRKMINFNELRIFPSAKGQHNMITFLTKGMFDSVFAKTCITSRKGNANSLILKNILNWNDNDTKYHKVTQNDLYEGVQNYIRLQGSSKNYTVNSLHSILNKVENQENVLDEYCDIKQGIVSGADKLTENHLKKYEILADKGEGIFVLNRNEVKNLHLNDTEMKYLKRFYKNSQILKYKIIPNNDVFVLYITKNTPIQNLPNIFSHLIKFKPILENKRECKNGKLPWYSLHWPRDQNILEKIKIVNPRRAKSNNFALENEKRYEQSDIMVSVLKEQYVDSISLKYILSLLNSRLYFIWLYFKGKRKGELLELYGTPLSEIPIKEISLEKQTLFINLVDQILGITKDDDYLETPSKQSQVKTLENQIDQLVYKLYDLTPEEIEIVEGFNESK